MRTRSGGRRGSESRRWSKSTSMRRRLGRAVALIGQRPAAPSERRPRESRNAGGCSEGRAPGSCSSALCSSTPASRVKRIRRSLPHKLPAIMWPTCPPAPAEPPRRQPTPCRPRSRREHPRRHTIVPGRSRKGSRRRRWLAPAAAPSPDLREIALNDRRPPNSEDAGADNSNAALRFVTSLAPRRHHRRPAQPLLRRVGGRARTGLLERLRRPGRHGRA